MQFRFWTTAIKSNVLINYHDAFSVIDLAKSETLTKADELFFSKNETIFLLAKGVDAGKKLIAPIIVETAGNYVFEHKTDLDDSFLEKSFVFTNRKVQEISTDGSGACLIGIHLKNNEITISHVGDNRAYLIRNGTLGQITVDQTLYDQILEDEGVEIEIWRKRITLQAICGNEELFPKVLKLNLMHSDKLILATDGIWSNVIHKNQGLV